jgi:VWFA-related protein
MDFKRIVFVALMFAVHSSAAIAQIPALRDEPSSIITTQSSMVLVPVLVRARSGALVYTLNAADFVITDNGIRQNPFLDQDSGREPLALVIVLEIGGAGARQYQNYSSIAPPLAPMLASMVGNVTHQVAVVTFDSHPHLLQGFTADTEEAATAVATLRPDCTRQHHLVDCESSNSVRDVPLGDNGAAILDSLDYAVNLLQSAPAYYRRAILLISESLDRGSETTIEQAVRDITGSNTTIYSLGFSTARSEAAHYAARQLPSQPSGRPSGLLSQENHHPNPPHGCMGKDPRPDPDATNNRWVQAYDCLGQLVPPLTFAKIAAIATVDGLRKNVPESVAQLTGGEYFRFTDSRSLERDLVTISNEIPNRYLLSFYPRSPQEGLHILSVSLPGHQDFQITSRSRYWADGPTR